MKQLTRLIAAFPLHIGETLRALFGTKKDELPAEVRAALQGCQNMEQLLDLLFSTDFNKDQAFLQAFEKRIGEIDPPF